MSTVWLERVCTNTVLGIVIGFVLASGGAATSTRTCTVGGLVAVVDGVVEIVGAHVVVLENVNVPASRLAAMVAPVFAGTAREPERSRAPAHVIERRDGDLLPRVGLQLDERIGDDRHLTRPALTVTAEASRVPAARPSETTSA